MENIFHNSKRFWRKYSLKRMTAKQRILQFIESKKLSNRKFCEKISVSHVYFSKKGAMGSDVLEKIAIIYPEINIDWVVVGRGKMIVDITEQKLSMVAEDSAPYGTNWKDKYYECLEKNNTLLEELAGKKTGKAE